MTNIYTYRIWDKITAIKGKPAEDWLSENPNFRDSDVLVVSTNGVDHYVECMAFVKAAYGLPDATNDEIAQLYVSNLEAETLHEPENVRRVRELEEVIRQLMKDSLK